MTKYLTNNFSIFNLYKKPSIKSEIVTQMIFGDSFSISKRYKKWLKIKIKEDGYKGFIKNKDFPSFLKTGSFPTKKLSFGVNICLTLFMSLTNLLKPFQKMKVEL